MILYRAVFKGGWGEERKGVERTRLVVIEKV